MNKLNIFNQVGLIALKIFGQPDTNDPQAMQPQLPYQELETEMKFDAGTIDRLRNLDAALQRAVAQEDFNQAKKLDEAIQNIKKVGV